MSEYSVTRNYYRTMTEGEVCRDQFLPAETEDEYNCTGRNDCKLILEQYAKRSETPLVKVLDFGCGDGRVARFMAKECTNLTCVDVSPHVLKLVGQKMKTYRNSNVNFILADDFNEENKYNFIYTLQVLQHCTFDDQIQLITKIKNALTEDGWALLHLPRLEARPGYINCETCMSFTQDQVDVIASYFSKSELDDRTINNDYEDYYLWVQK